MSAHPESSARATTPDPAQDPALDPGPVPGCCAKSVRSLTGSADRAWATIVGAR